MHGFHDESLHALGQAVLKYAEDRLKLDPVPLDGPRSEEELDRIAGQTITPDGIECAFSTGDSFTSPTQWASAEEVKAAGIDPTSVELADINGDGRADLCGTSPSGRRPSSTPAPGSRSRCRVRWAWTTKARSSGRRRSFRQFTGRKIMRKMANFRTFRFRRFA